MGCCTGSAFTPAPDAALDPLQRVNYSFGMVLGVDDFRQEQTYLMARDDRLLRELVGYGAIRGLTVSLQGSQVRVSPGMALMPDGRLVAVQAEQCADFASWRATQKLATPSMGDDQTVYVRLFAADASGAPVPIPGEPCRDESELSADARIADSFLLDFSLTAPDASEDLALRAAVAWIRSIRVGPSGMDLDKFCEKVRKELGDAITTTWGNPHAPGSPLPALSVPAKLPPPSAGLRIPRAQLADYYAAAFDVWVQLLRSGLMAHHGPVPAAEALAERGLLLAAIDVKGGAAKGIRMLGRQQLLHLRLLQEWLLRDGSQDAPREAHYVLGKRDPELDHAQDLLADFKEHDHAITRIDIVTDSSDDGGNVARIVPAVKWPGGGKGGGPDYYGPDMTQPIPVADGGTGQSAPPPTGSLLVGRAESGSGSSRVDAHFELGSLVGDRLTKPSVPSPNILVDLAQAPKIRLDTVQDIGPDAHPSFAALDVSGMLAADHLVVETDAWVKDKLQVDGELVLGQPKRSLLATSDSGVVVEARAWDGDETALGKEPSPPYVYEPGQPAPVRIEDGGTGLQQRPLNMQMLIGFEPKLTRGQGGDYVLATLVAGKGISVSLDPVRGGESESVQRTLTITATGGGGGGSTNVVAGGNPPSLTAAVNSDGTVIIDTVQPLHGKAAPTFQGLSLAAPPVRATKVFMGWDGKTGELVRTEVVFPPPLSVVAAGNASNPPSLTAAVTAGTVTLDTVQPLHPAAQPRFRGLSLSEPNTRPGGAPLAWDARSGELVLDAGRRGITTVTAAASDGGPPSLTAVTSSDVVTLDTVQPLHPAAAPRFGTLSLTDLPDGKPSTWVGWDSNSGQLVQAPAPTGAGADVGRWGIRIVDGSGPRPTVTDDDQVLVFRNGGNLSLPNLRIGTRGGKSFSNGRVIVIKAMRNGGPVLVDGHDQQQVNLEPGTSLTVIAAMELVDGPQWLVIGRS